MTVLFSNYFPKLRTWLGQAEIEDVKLWSVYDYIQRVTLTDRNPLQVNDFTWPAADEFIRMYDRIVVLVGHQPYANIFFTYPKADLIDRIDFLRNGQVYQQLTIDDRGFVSRALFYQGNTLVKAEYLSQGGQVVMVHDYTTSQIQVQWPDGRTENYFNITDVAQAALSEWLAQQGEDDWVVLVEPSSENLALAKAAERQHPVFVLNYPFLGARPDQQVSSAELLNFKTISGQHQISSIDGLVQEPAKVLAPFTIDHDIAESRPQEDFVAYWRQGLVDSGKIRKYLNTLVDLAVENANFVTIIENDRWQESMQPVLTDLINQKQADQHLDDDQVRRLTGQFVLIDWQSKEKRQSFLQTAAVVLDLAVDTDLVLQSQALAVGVPALTIVQNAYQKADNRPISSATELRDRLEALLDKTYWQNFHIELVSWKKYYTPLALAQQWQDALTVKNA